ncbi:MAG TPA: glycoside hydrolase family 15 protein [Kineosporiaceae bacterium]|nr:glycoside hydrolase family 15 protein [Kineosporiaceae bacterium]
MTTTAVGSDAQFVRARSASTNAAVPAQRTQVAMPETDFQAVAQHMFALLLRNVASDGYRFADPTDSTKFSIPGCVVAAPSFPASTPGVDQDYVFNWTRDAAITAMEIVAAELPTTPGAGVQPLIDYVNFAKICQDNATPTAAHACFTIEGQSRPWTEQSDGPALQTLALLQAFPQLDANTRAIAEQIIGKHLSFLLGAYQEPTTNLWEEHSGYSFFARAAQLRCLRAISSGPDGIAVPPGTSEAITWLENALQGHWDGTRYLTLLAEAPGQGAPVNPAGPGYDPNIDIVMAAIYGAIPVTDTKLLATAGLLRAQWSEGGAAAYAINVADRARGVGPMMGRYPGDTYDGDMADHVIGGHPWALCTANFAELYYRLANEIATSGAVPYDDLSSAFFDQVGVGAGAPLPTVVAALEQAGDAMLKAIIYHSDNLELSEQFDGWTGYEKSVRDLTWSYAAFLSAVRAKTSCHVQG